MTSRPRTTGRFALPALILLSSALAAGCAEPPTVAIDRKLDPPAWAMKQRELLAVNAEIARAWDKLYLDANGWANVNYEHGGGVQAPDDLFECIYKLPLVHTLGADQDTLDIWWKAWRGSIPQCTKAGLFSHEMAKYLDWHHSAEQYEGFWLAAIPLAEDSEYRRQAIQFAAYYDGSDPNVPNYDPDKKMIRSMLHGGAGPNLHPKLDDWIGGNLSENQKQFWSAWLNPGGDGPVNLVTTCFGTNAFLLTGEQRYRKSTLEYIDAWQARAKANGGIIPSLVNLDGQVPKNWYDGVLGWNFRQFGGLFQVSGGPKAAWNNALLLTGEKRYFDPMRTLGDELWAHRTKDRDGHVTVPRYRGPDGWYGDLWRTGGIYASLLTNVYLATMDAADLDRALERGEVQGMAGHATYHEGGYEPHWLAFLTGGDPNWPRNSLAVCIRNAQGDLDRLNRIAEKATPGQHFKDALQCGWAGPLVNQMTGAIMPLWHGQLLYARLLYFDPAAKRVGIPRDCAALVEKMTDDSTTVLLVNTGEKPRKLWVQAGAYAEHQFLTVTPEGGKAIPVNGTVFAVTLAPHAGQRLAIRMKRFANTPTLARPWTR